MLEEYDDPSTLKYSNEIADLNRRITIPEIRKSFKSTGKSTDNFNFHPKMFSHLGEKAMSTIETLFNLCLEKHIWVWNGAQVIFLRKAGKDSYSKPGSYRPICITAYIGKLLESIIAKRIETLILTTNQTDPYQEGFSRGRNTIRYLSRLHLEIEADKEKLLTTLCLFVDFEKAFDSIWKKGLMMKLHSLGIQGDIAKLINNFLFTREVTLNVNGTLGATRQSAEYGLPQGSALSPVLFKIYVMDLLTELQQNPNISILKFADDGTVKISAADSVTCLNDLNLVLDCLHGWSKKWRLKINCDRNKTEVICFNTAENDRDAIPKSFKLGDKEIYRVSETKVLGLIIDEDLNYNSHSKMILKSLYGRWATVCKYTNKHWGFNLQVMLYLLKTLFISKLSYAGHIWITKHNITEISSLWYHILKSIIGAVPNLKYNIAEIILGIPPILIQTKVNSIKHFLKTNNQPIQNDIYKLFLSTNYNAATKEPKIIHKKLKEVFDFLKWKINHYPTHFTIEDRVVVMNSYYNDFVNLSVKACTYTQMMMQKYTEEVLWFATVKTQFQLDGYPSSPLPSCDIIPFSTNTSREKEVQFMSLLYKNNLLNQFLYNISKVPSPLCSYCSIEEETAEHLLFKCSYIKEEIRLNVMAKYEAALNSRQLSPDIDSYTGFLSVCKNNEFVKSCIDVLNCIKLKVVFVL